MTAPVDYLEDKYMSYIIVHGKVNKKWSNGISGEKRGLNLVIADGLLSYKAMFWQEDSDWTDEHTAIGDELYIRGQVADYWRYKNKVIGIEVSEPEILSISSWNDVKADLIKRISADTAIDKDQA